MKRALTLLIPLSLVVAACGGDDDATSATGPAPTVDAGDDQSGETPSSGDDSEADTETGTDSGTDGDGASPPPTGDSSSTYCQVARQFQESADEIDEAIDPFDFSPERFREAFEFASRGLDEIRRVAPPEIRDDVQTVADGFVLLRDELEAADYNFFAMDPTAFIEIGEELEAASERVEAYNESVCGIPRSFDDDFDMDLGDLEDFGDLDMGDLEDLFGDLDMGDMEGLFGDLDMGEMGGFGELMRQGMLDGFVSDGFSPAEAECLVDAILEFDVSNTDMDDPFERCGVSFDP